MSLTYNKNTHARTRSDKTSTRIIATISKNKHMYYSHVKKFKIMLKKNHFKCKYYGIP